MFSAFNVNHLLQGASNLLDPASELFSFLRCQSNRLIGVLTSVPSTFRLSSQSSLSISFSLSVLLFALSIFFLCSLPVSLSSFSPPTLYHTLRALSFTAAGLTAPVASQAHVAQPDGAILVPQVPWADQFRWTAVDATQAAEK